MYVHIYIYVYIYIYMYRYRLDSYKSIGYICVSIGLFYLYIYIYKYMIEGSLEAKLPTIWKDGNGTARKKLGRGES